MREGLSPADAAKELAEEAKRDSVREHERRDTVITIAEVVLLSIVTVLTAWTGYAAAKWYTKSQVALSVSSTLRVDAARAENEAEALRNFDSSTFEAWFAAYVAGNEAAMRLAEHRFRPEFRVAFDAWRATNPETNPNAPRGPTFMPEYVQPGLVEGRELDRRSEAAFREGESSAADSDRYVRLIVVLASILFLMGISTHVPVRALRYWLVGLATLLLIVSIVQLAILPRPPL